METIRERCVKCKMVDNLIFCKECKKPFCGWCIYTKFDNTYVCVACDIYDLR